MAPESNGPPAGWTPSEQYTALTERPKPSVVVDLPVVSYSGQRYDRVRLQVLRDDEIGDASVRAIAHVQEQFKANKVALEPDALASNPVAANQLQIFTAAEKLARAVVSVNGLDGQTNDGRKTTIYARLFRDAKDVRRLLGEDELATLYAQYLSVQRERGPIISRMTPDEVDAWIAVTEEGSNQHPLARLTWPALAQLTLSLIARLVKCTGSKTQPLPSEQSPNGQESEGTKSPTGISSSTGGPVAPGLVYDSPDPGDVPIGADPDEAASIVRSLTPDDDLQ